MNWQLTRRSALSAAGLTAAAIGTATVLAACAREETAGLSTSTSTSAAPDTPVSAPATITQPAPGIVMQPGYATTFARTAYVWAWPLVNMFNRNAAITQAPRPGRLNGVLPAAPRGRLAMLSDYIDPAQTFIACPNQDVVYGLSYMSLDVEPVIIRGLTPCVGHA